MTASLSAPAPEPAASARHYERYVAIGDSSTEGLDDPSPSGGYRGWANRLAEKVARSQGSLLYANLAVRGRTTPRVRAEQLEPALALQPDLVTVFSGTNDVVRRRFDLGAVAADIEAMQLAFRCTGATVLTLTMPDLSPVMPVARLVTSRLEELNRAVREISSRTGTRVIDLAAHPLTSDHRLWGPDRLHANSEGHARIASALAHALGLEDGDAWLRPLPPEPPPSLARRVCIELAWAGRYFLPWLWRHARGRSSGDGRGPKRPELRPVALDSAQRPENR